MSEAVDWAGLSSRLSAYSLSSEARRESRSHGRRAGEDEPDADGPDEAHRRAAELGAYGPRGSVHA